MPDCIYIVIVEAKTDIFSDTHVQACMSWANANDFANKIFDYCDNHGMSISIDIYQIDIDDMSRFTNISNN